MSESRVPEEPSGPEGAGLEHASERERQMALLEELLAQGTPGTAGLAAHEESAPWTTDDPGSRSLLGAGELLKALGAPAWLSGRRTSRVVAAVLLLPVMLLLALKLDLLHELLR